MIQAITFDADGTLWDFESAMRQAQTIVLDALRHRLPDCPAWLTVDRRQPRKDSLDLAPAQSCVSSNCAGVLPMCRRMLSVIASATSPSPENTSSAPAWRMIDATAARNGRRPLSTRVTG